MFHSITRRPLWFNILVALGLVVLVFAIFILSLNWITRHGSSKTVPAVAGKNINDAEKLLSDKGFETVIQDSVFYDSLPPGIVIRQVPDPDAVVKVNRTVYVIINRFVAPDISLPNILNVTFRNARYTLERNGLRLGDTSSREDFAAGTVLEIRYNGQVVKPGDKVKMGSRIDLVIARGLGVQDVAVPNLIGLTLTDARIKLDELGINIDLFPVANANVTDPDNAFIWRQEPTPRAGDGIPIRIRSGQTINVWLQADPVAAPAPVDTTSGEEQ